MEPIEVIINPWVKQLESAFAPYPEFISAVLSRLQQLDLAITESAEVSRLELAQAEARALALAMKSQAAETGSNQPEEMNLLLSRFEEELTSARKVAEGATQDLIALKRELQFTQGELSGAKS